MSQSTLTIDIKYNTEALNQLESQLEHIAELMDRIRGRRDNHLRQIVREEIRQFVNHEIRQSGMFSR
ncbi:hypothetical protein [Xenorhabdus sp. TH1]|uniref:hypothetical protein n=1 Tax=Xenorhabdus sp. TH1 TaxID=3130166 RepID=UPI0030CB2DF9